MLEKRATHLGKQGFDQIEPGSVLWGMNIDEPVGPGSQPVPGLFGDMGGMVVQNHPDGRVRSYDRS